VASASYNAANHQLTFGSTTLTYDLNGNLTSDGTNTYTWDARNRLVAITGGSAASFQYDGQGRRISKTINSAQTGFLYDGLTPVQELDGSTVVANLLTSLGIDEYLTRTDTSGTSHFLGDALGSTIALTDSIGSVSSSYTYAPFGATGLSGSATGNVFDYTGREDDGTGLKYYRARYYHPGLQRFVSEDPIGFAGGDPNLYAYVFDAPTGYRDPSGLAVDPVSLTALAIFCGGGAVVNVTTKFALAGRKPTLGEAASAAAIGCGLGVLTLTAGIAAGVAGTGVLLAGEVATTGTGTAAGLTGAGTALSGVAATTAGQILSKAEPWGSALKSDAYHRAATYMRAEAATRGAHFRLPGGSTLTQIPGGLNGANGRYDYIVDQAGRLTHQFFVPGGTINGTPIAP